MEHAFCFLFTYYFAYSKLVINFATINQRNKVMTAIEMNAEILRNMSIIAEDEHLLKRAAKYLRKLVAEREDPTLFTKEDFFARIDKAKEGPSYELKEGESITDLIERIG